MQKSDYLFCGGLLSISIQMSIESYNLILSVSTCTNLRLKFILPFIKTKKHNPLLAIIFSLYQILHFYLHYG